MLLLAAFPVQSQESLTIKDDSSAILDPYREAAIKRWEKEIVKLEQRDANEADPPDGILLLGSSSIRLWESAAVEMTPYRVISRGYGGARYTDLAVFAKRLIEPHRYRAVVIYVGNDISGAENDRTPDEVEPLVRYLIRVSQAHQPDAPVFIVEVTPTPKRLAVWDRIRRLNDRLREITFTEKNAYIITTAEYYLTSDDQPRSELFREDRLHQNAAGYAIWSHLIHRRLDEVLRTRADEVARATTTVTSDTAAAVATDAEAEGATASATEVAN
jgi:lysophospholipase L1-like esterase